MRRGISLSVLPADLDRLRAFVRDRSAPQKHVWRAWIVLLSAEGVATNTIVHETGKSKTCVWRWQERFAAEGFEGLLRDKARPSRIRSSIRLSPSAPFPPARPSTRSSTTMPPTSIRPCANGSRAIRDGSSTSRRPQLLWLNAVEGFFATLMKRRLKRGVLPFGRRSPRRHQPVSRRPQRQSKPIQWVADPDKIIAPVKRGHQALDSIH
jgi:Winged helix-turn helix